MPRVFATRIPCRAPLRAPRRPWPGQGAPGADGGRAGAPPRAGRAALVTALVTAFVAVLAAAGLPPVAVAAPARPEVLGTIDERGMEGVTFEVQVPEARTAPVEIAGRTFTGVSVQGFGLTSDPGLPVLPRRGFTIAVPPGYEPVPQVRILESEVLDIVPAPSREPTIEIDDAGLGVPGFVDRVDEDFYGSSRVYPEVLFTASPVSRLRQQRVFELVLFPARYDAGRRQLVVARRLEVRVDFRPVAGLRGDAGSEFLPASPVDRGFEPVYRGTIVNYESSRSWRLGPRRAALAPRGAAPLRRQQNREWKLEVRETGMVRVGFEGLPGFPSGIPVGDLELVEKTYVPGAGAQSFVSEPVAIEVTDANQNGTFDAGDSILFYGRNHRSRFGPNAYLNRFTDDNVYWLTWTEGGGARVASRPGWLDLTSPTVPASFPDTVHIEEDLINFDYAPHPIASPSYSARELVSPWHLTRNLPRAQGGFPNCTGVDPYCVVMPDEFGRCDCVGHDFPFEIWGIDRSQPAGLRALMVSARDGFTHLATFSVFDAGSNETRVVTRWPFSGHLAIGTFESEPDSLPGTALSEGQNTVRFVGERQAGGAEPILNKALAQLDWVEVLYQRRYEAHNGLLEFTDGGVTGDVEYRISGFRSSNIRVYDITTPQSMERLTPVEIIDEGGGNYAVSLQDQVTAPRRYVALVAGGSEAAPRTVVEDSPSSLASPAVEPDLIMVVYDGFADLVQPLADHREAQGHTVEVARLSDVYDEFEGGIRRTSAIRNYLRYAFENWSRPPLYLLLVGDGNEDYKDIVPSGINLVPSELFFGPVRGDLDLELISTDSWYVAGLGPGDDEWDLNFDMYVGRLPAQTAEECSDLVAKVIDYEDFQPNDRWRARTLTICDDAWSSTISFNDVYRFRSQETIFCRICDSLNAMVGREFGDLIDTRSWKLSTYSDQLPEEGRFPGLVEAHIDTTGLPLLYDVLISDGNLLMNYQGHANKHLLAHERIFSSEFDHHQDRFNNLGKPSIWALFACHPNEFDEWDERVADQVGGRERSTGELLLSLPQGGLIASLASTGFEWLPGSTVGGPPFQYDLNSPFWSAFFEDPPAADPAGDPTEPSWILGAVVHKAKQLYNAFDSFKGPMWSYVLLGDPALRVDAIPPTFEVAAADTLRDNGARIEVWSTASDTVRVVADVVDEVRIDTVDLSEIAIVDGSIRQPDPALVTVDSLGGSARHLEVVYRAPIRPDAYDIVVRASDSNGRQIDRRLAVRVDLAARAGGVPFQDGDFVPNGSVIAVDLHTPVPLTAGDVALLVSQNGGEPQPIDELEVTARDAIGKDWTATGRLDVVAGQHTLIVALEKNGTPGLAREIRFQSTRELALEQVAVYPNPFDAQTTINYQLTNEALAVAIRIFTISGRLVAELEGPVNAGYSQVIWDGRDDDGDAVSNGVYIYRILARGDDREDTHLGKIIRSRR
jgi:hypothetical protein